MNGYEVKQAANNYIAALPSMKRSEYTVKAYKTALFRFAEYIGQERNETEIDALAVVDFRKWLHEQNTTENTISEYMTRLHGFFAWCIRMKLTDENPVRTEEIPDLTERTYDLLGLSELQTIMNNPPNRNTRKYYRNYVIVVLLLQTGLRSAELRDLTPADLNFADGTITVRNGKGNKKRQVPFPAQSRKLVSDYLTMGYRPLWCTEQDYLFGTDADRTGHSTGGKCWERLSSAGLLGIVNRYTERICGHSVGVHTLRHAAASYWDEIGVPIRDVQKALGHSSVSLTEKVYVEILNKQGAALTINAAYDRV